MLQRTRLGAPHHPSDANFRHARRTDSPLGRTHPHAATLSYTGILPIPISGQNPQLFGLLWGCAHLTSTACYARTSVGKEFLGHPPLAGRARCLRIGICRLGPAEGEERSAWVPMLLFSTWTRSVHGVPQDKRDECHIGPSQHTTCASPQPLSFFRNQSAGIHRTPRGVKCDDR